MSKRDDERQDPALIFANFDPDEWGPCDDAEHALPFFQFMSRCALAAGAIAAAGAFFYYLEEMKRQQKMKQREAKAKVIDNVKVIDEDDEEEGIVHRIVRIANQLYSTWQEQRVQYQHNVDADSVLSHADTFVSGSEATEYQSVRSGSPSLTINTPTPPASPMSARKSNISVTTTQHTKTFVQEVTTSSGEYPNPQPIPSKRPKSRDDSEQEISMTQLQHEAERLAAQMAEKGNAAKAMNDQRADWQTIEAPAPVLPVHTLVMENNDLLDDNTAKNQPAKHNADLPNEQKQEHEQYNNNVAVAESARIVVNGPQHQQDSNDKQKKRITIESQQVEVVEPLDNEQYYPNESQLNVRIDDDHVVQHSQRPHEQIEETRLAEKLLQHADEDVGARVVRGDLHAPTPPPSRRESMNEPDGHTMEHPSSGIAPPSPLEEEDDAWELLKRDGADSHQHKHHFDQHVMLEAQRRFSIKPRSNILDANIDPHLIALDAQNKHEPRFEFFVDAGDEDDEQVVELAHDYGNDPHYHATGDNAYKYDFMQQTFHESSSNKQFDVLQENEPAPDDAHAAALQARTNIYQYDFIVGDDEDARASTAHDADAAQAHGNAPTAITQFADEFTNQIFKEVPLHDKPPKKEHDQKKTSITEFADQFTNQIIKEVSDVLRHEPSATTEPLVFGHVGQDARPSSRLNNDEINTVEHQQTFLTITTSNVDAKVLTEDEQKVHSPPLPPARRHKKPHLQQTPPTPPAANGGTSGYEDFNDAPVEQRYDDNNAEPVLIHQVTHNQRMVKQAAEAPSVTDEPSATDAGDIESIEMDDDKHLLRSPDRQFLEQATHEVDVMTSKLNEKQLKQLLQIDAINYQSPTTNQHQEQSSPGFKEAFAGFPVERQPSAPQMFAADGSPLSARKVQETATHRTPKASRKQTERKVLKAQRSDSIMEATGTNDIQVLLKKYKTLESWSKVMRDAGLTSCNLIFGIDYTASNKYQGEHSFNNRSLHSIAQDTANPYQQVIRIMGRTLGPMTTSGVIPVYGFGDLYTSDWSVFALKTDGYCQSFEEVLSVYNEVTPNVTLSGPTNFAPLIYQAIEICQKMGDYHILVIVADGQVTNERATRRAIVDACAYPLSIIVVGVGDGPWQMMRVFDDSLPKRPWDNFHFVEFHELIKQAGQANTEVAFSVNALLEIPDQYKMIKKLGLL